jgi:hypothetical protein
MCAEQLLLKGNDVLLFDLTVEEQQAFVGRLNGIERASWYEVKKIANYRITSGSIVGEDARQNLLEMQAKFCPTGRSGHGVASRQYKNEAMVVTRGCTIA